MVTALSTEQESKGLESKDELFFLFTDTSLVAMEFDKEGNNKVSPKPSSAVLPHKKNKKSSVLAADPAGMQKYSAFKGDRGQIQVYRAVRCNTSTHVLWIYNFWQILI